MQRQIFGRGSQMPSAQQLVESGRPDILQAVAKSGKDYLPAVMCSSAITPCTLRAATLVSCTGSVESGNRQHIALFPLTSASTVCQLGAISHATPENKDGDATSGACSADAS